MPFSFVKNMARRIKNILETNDSNLEFKRVNIPKKQEDEEKVKKYVEKGVTQLEKMQGVNLRPLGVPKHS